MSLSKALSVLACNLGDGRDDSRCAFGARFDIGEAISGVSGHQQ